VTIAEDHRLLHGAIPVADISIAMQTLIVLQAQHLAQSGHRLEALQCPLLTQSGHLSTKQVSMCGCGQVGCACHFVSKSRRLRGKKQCVRYAKVWTITGPAIAVAGAASRGVRLCSIHARMRLFDSAAPA
jgi:hypothetical protein